MATEDRKRLAMPRNEATYYTEGNVRGACDHKHKTPRAAGACSARDMRGCRRQGGYSDRWLYRHDGIPVTQEETDEFRIGHRGGARP